MDTITITRIASFGTIRELNEFLFKNSSSIEYVDLKISDSGITTYILVYKTTVTVKKSQ